MNRIAIYDMDKTITRRPTFTPFLLHSARTLNPARLLLIPFVLVTIFLYAVRLIDRGRLKELNHALLIGRVLPVQSAKSVAAGFATMIISSNVLTDATRRIASDRAEGYRLVMATASYAFYASAIAQMLGFEATIGTRAATSATGDVLARINGENCYGPAKRRMVEAWLAQQGLVRAECHIRFYSDHVSDAPMLEWADEAFVVNGHGPLKQLAHERGWPSFDWH